MAFFLVQNNSALPLFSGYEHRSKQELITSGRLLSVR